MFIFDIYQIKCYICYIKLMIYIKMKTATTISSVSKRESFLIQTYNENSTSSYSFKKAKKKERASNLLSELRSRYGVQIVIKAVDMKNVTNETITQNGRYALD